MASCAAEQTELPWSTVMAIDVVSGGYLVKTLDDDGILDSILISNL